MSNKNIKKILDNISDMYYCTHIDDNQLEILMKAHDYHILACYDMIGILYIRTSDLLLLESLLTREIYNVTQDPDNDEVLMINNKDIPGKYSIPLLRSDPIRINEDYVIAAHEYRLMSLYKNYKEEYSTDLPLDSVVERSKEY